MQTVPLDLMTPYGNREQATDLLRSATGLPLPTAHSLVLTLDAVSGGVLRAAGVPTYDALPILAALWRHPKRITDATQPRTAPIGGTEYLRDLGERVHVIRRARRLTVTGVHRLTGVSPFVLRDLEAGCTWPSLVLLLRLAEAFQVPLPMLVDDRATALRVLRLLAMHAA